jgi:hypothetical protein
MDKSFQVCSGCLNKTQNLLLPKYFKTHDFCFVENKEDRVIYDNIRQLKIADITTNEQTIFGAHVNWEFYSKQERESFLGTNLKRLDDNSLNTIMSNRKTIFIAWRHFGIQKFAVSSNTLVNISEFEKLHNLVNTPRFACFSKSRELSLFAFPENDDYLYRFPSLNALVRFLHPGGSSVSGQVWIPTPDFLKLFPFTRCETKMTSTPNIDDILLDKIDQNLTIVSCLRPEKKPLTEILDSERIQDII